MIIRRYQRITIINSGKPSKKDLNEELQYFCTGLGLFSLRDKDRSCFRIFIELLKTVKLGEALSSDEIANRLELSRGTVVHHLSRLMESGLVVNHKNRYMLRVNNLQQLVEEIKKDLDRMTTDLKETAEEIDKWLGL